MLCGFVTDPSPKMQKVGQYAAIFNIIMSITGIFTVLSYVWKSNNILDIAESCAQGTTAVVHLVKVIVFWLYAEDLFDCMDEFVELNDFCEFFWGTNSY